MTRAIRYGVMALMMLGTAGFAQSQEKSQQNTADEALTDRNPSQGVPQGNEAKQDRQPQTGPQMAIPGNQSLSNDPVFTDGKLTAPGAPPQTQDTPAKFSAKNGADDRTPITAWPLPLTDDQKRAVIDSIGKTQSPILAMDLKPSQKFDDWTQYQDLPSGLTDSIPMLRGYKYVRLQDKVLLINPSIRVVTDEITNKPTTN
jgi:hypothetical protein